MLSEILEELTYITYNSTLKSALFTKIQSFRTCREIFYAY